VRQALQPSVALAPGFAMIELLAIAAASIALTAVAWGGYQRSAERRTVATEADTVAAIARNTARTYASRGDYGALTQSSALAQGVFPARLITANGSVANAWGGAVNLAAVSTDGGATNNGFTITYSNVPSSACVALATNAGSGFAEVTVRNTNAGSWRPAGAAQASPTPDAIQPPGVPGLHDGSVLSTTQASRVDPALAASHCANILNSVAFTYLTAAVARTSCVGSGSIPPVYANQGASCPMGSNGLSQLVADEGPDQYQSTWTQTHQRDGACNASGTIDYGPWSPWAPTYTCADRCVPVSTTATATQTYTCPGTGLITTPGPSQYQHQGPQSQTITTSQTCTTPIGPLSMPPTVSSTRWSPVYACAPPCSAPPSSTTTATRACPVGQIDGQAPFTAAGIVDMTTRSWACPLPVGPATYTDTTTTQNRCAPACVLPSPSTQTQCAGTPQSVACPAGMTVGSHTFQLLDTRSATCAAPIGSATWGAWSTTTTRCNELNNCAFPPPPPCVHTPSPPTTRYGACPANPTGWLQSQTCTENACPPAGGPTTWSCSGVWTPATAPPSCSPPVCPPPHQTCIAATASYTAFGVYTGAGPTYFCTETKACPAGYSGSNTSYKSTWQDGAGGACGTWGAWQVYTPGSGCTANPPSCTWPAAPTTTPACSGGGNQTGGTWQHAACPSWTYAGGACPPSPPACTWPPAPTTTPACPSGGNQTGGAWVHAATCPNWLYTGGACAPPPPPPVAAMCIMHWHDVSGALFDTRYGASCAIYHAPTPCAGGCPPTGGFNGFTTKIGDSCNTSTGTCSFANPSQWSMDWQRTDPAIPSPGCLTDGVNTCNPVCNEMPRVVVTYLPTGTTTTINFFTDCEPANIH